MRYFFVANFIDNGISNYLNLIKFLADPKNFSYVHLTLKGPFINQQISQFQKIKTTLENINIKLLYVDNFFEYNQNTVFFRCEKNETLYNIWKSKSERTYKFYNPHITLYDGDNKEFSSKLFKILENIHLDLDINIDEVDIYNKSRKTEIFMFASLDFSLLEIENIKHLDKTFLINHFQSISFDERLIYIKNLVQNMTTKFKINNKNYS